MALALQNILELSWILDCSVGTICPYCEKNIRMKVEITYKHVRLDCPTCGKVFFYRRVNLGAIEK